MGILKLNVGSAGLTLPQVLPLQSRFSFEMPPQTRRSSLTVNQMQKLSYNKYIMNEKHVYQVSSFFQVMFILSGLCVCVRFLSGINIFNI